MLIGALYHGPSPSQRGLAGHGGLLGPGGGGASQAVVDVEWPETVMGHVVPGMGTVYREKVSDERLRAVCEHVRVWLFGKAKKPKPK